jgi:uncharacterized protein
MSLQTLPVQPVGSPPANERQSLVDALRGFALLGILVVNIASFASAYYGVGLPDPMAQSVPERAALFVRTLLFETKFYLLFSFLFGYSFTLQMQSAERAGKAFAPRMLRRLVGLWVIGVAHAVLLYHGDILSDLCGAGPGAAGAAAPGRASCDGRCAIGLVLLTSLMWASLATCWRFRPCRWTARGALRGRAGLAGYRGTPATVMRPAPARAVAAGVVWAGAGAVALAMFFAGFMAGRRRWFANVEALGRVQARWDSSGAWPSVRRARVFYADRRAAERDSAARDLALSVAC